MRVLGILVPVALAACAVPQERGPLVPIAALLAETADRPWECIAPDAAGRSCEAVARMRIEGAVVVNDALVLMSERPQIALASRDRLRIMPDGRACGGIVDSVVEVRGEAEPLAAELVRAGAMAGAEAFGTICYGYYRAGAGYRVEATDSEGRPIAELSYDATFSADQPALRVPEAVGAEAF